MAFADEIRIEIENYLNLYDIYKYRFQRTIKNT